MKESSSSGMACDFGLLPLRFGATISAWAFDSATSTTRSLVKPMVCKNIFLTNLDSEEDGK